MTLLYQHDHDKGYVCLMGKADLKNEIANSWTAGVQIRPQFARRFALNVDWVHIDVQNAIVSLTALQVLNACYDAASYPVPGCANVTRTPAGQVSFIRTGYENAAVLKFAGLLVQADYAIPTPFLSASGKVSLTAQYQYIDTLQQQVGTGDLDLQAGSLETGGAGALNNTHKFTTNLNYDSDFLNLQLQVQYYGSAVFNANEAAGTRDFQGVPAVVFLNATIGANISKHIGLRLNVDNLLDQDPPYPATADSLGTYFSGIRGRYYRASASVRF